MNQKLVLVLGILMVASVAFAQNPPGQGPTYLNGGLTGTPGGFTGSGPNNQGGPGLGRHDLWSTATSRPLGCERCHLPHTAPTWGATFLWAWRNMPTMNLPTYETPTNPSGYLAPVPTAVTGPPIGNSRSMLCFSCHDGTSMNANNIQGGNTYNGTPYPLINSGTNPNGLQTEHPVDAIFPNRTDYAQPVLVTGGWYDEVAYVGIDQLPLWYAGAPGHVTTSPGVECGTCHDVHNDYTADNGPNGGIPFLRVANTYGTYLCRECHNAQ